MTEAQAVRQIEIARKAVAQAQEALATAEAQLRDARRAYAKARPLTESERDILACRVEGGSALCCREGRTWLRKRLPPIWAEALNDWAYRALACSERRPERIVEYGQKVRALKLDELP